MGLGPDGTWWGGELLYVTFESYRRLASLEPIALPGGERAVREPWRVAVAWLAKAFEQGDEPKLAWHARRDPRALASVQKMIERGINAPATSSCGRLFDAVASLLDCGDAVSYEGAAACALEALAASAPRNFALAWAGNTLPALSSMTGLESEVVPAADLVKEVVGLLHNGCERAIVAHIFHVRLAERLAAAALAHARRLDLRRVVLTGGCFQNRLLLEAVSSRLREGGAEPLLHRRIPPNDGGLAVGQAAIVAAQLALIRQRPRILWRSTRR